MLYLFCVFSLFSAVVLFRPAADETELRLLLGGALGLDPETSHTHHAVIALTRAYHSLMSLSRPPLSPGGIVFRDRFGLRDFYNFGRFFTRKRKPYDAPVPLLMALERNFNGVSKAEFDVIVDEFMSSMVAEGQFAPIHDLPYRSVIAVLYEALQDRSINPMKMNETIVRYQLVLDDTVDDSAARLLFQSGILDQSKTIVYDLSHFPDDQNDVVRSTMISNIKRAMNTGKTLFLMHTAQIHGSLYDLLNQHFSHIEKEDGSVAFFANVAVGSYSKPCQVIGTVM